MNKPPVEEKFPDESLLNRSKFSYKIDCYIIFIESGKRLVANAKQQMLSGKNIVNLIATMVENTSSLQVLSA